jgi:hypothetical protein
VPRFTVFHYTGDRLRSFSEAAFLEDWPGPAYVRVGQVDADSLGEVFASTNHLDTPWTDNPNVLLLPEDLLTLAAARARDPKVNSSLVLRKRSTSVGDVIVNDATGEANGVAGIGFTPLDTVVHAAAGRLHRLRTEFRETVAREADATDLYNAILALQDYLADLRDGREAPWSYRQEAVSVNVDG